MNKHSTTPLTGEQVTKRMFWLAWQACGSPQGMGIFQDNPSATEEDIWNNIHDGPRGGDYSGRTGQSNPNPTGKAHGDYVFGRMMKLYLEFDGESITTPASTPRQDYQEWSWKFPDYETLFLDAMFTLTSKEKP